MAAIDNTQISNVLNALTPTGAAGIPGTFTAFAASAMRIRLNSTLSTASAAGTELSTQTSGYTNGTGWNALGASTASSAGSAVGVPLTTQSFVSNGSPTAVGQLRPDVLGGGAGVLGAVQRPAGQRRVREHVPGGRRLAVPPPGIQISPDVSVENEPGLDLEKLRSIGYVSRRTGSRGPVGAGPPGVGAAVQGDDGRTGEHGHRARRGRVRGVGPAGREHPAGDGPRGPGLTWRGLRAACTPTC